MKPVLTKSERLRPKTKLTPFELNLVYSCEGIGGYIQFTPAMRWVYEQNEHIYGAVFCTEMFYELAKLWFWHLRERVKIKKYTVVHPQDFIRVFGRAHIMPNPQQLFTSIGAHPLRLGFNYFANLDYVPDGYDSLPKIVGDETSIFNFNLPEKYAVVTTEATTGSRMLKAETINEICKYLIGKGITPVFLGKKRISHQFHDFYKYEAKSPVGLDLNGVLDFREKTSLLEAACILANAEVVVGLDNGLLHLASCSEVPIVWGFNTVDPIHRIPPRDGKIILVVPPASLPCRFCQSHTRYVRDRHDFRQCYYDDFMCIDLLDSEPFIEAIEKVGVG